MSNFVVIGAGLLGNELKKIITDMGHNVKIVQKVEAEQQVIPDGSDIVIITAQSADYKESNLTPDLLYVNTILPLQIIQQSIKANVKKIAYCSSGSVYDDTCDEHIENEKILLNTINPYKATKYSAELLIKSFIGKFERVVIFRPFFMYGSYQNKNMLFSRIINSIKTGKTINLTNKKGLIFNPIHVKDAAMFVYQAILDKKDFDLCNIAGQETTSLQNIVEILSTILEKKATVNFPNGKETTLLGSIKKMKLFNFHHKIDLKTGLSEMVGKNIADGNT